MHQTNLILKGISRVGGVLVCITVGGGPGGLALAKAMAKHSARMLAMVLLILAGTIPNLQRQAEAAQQVIVWEGGNGDWNEETRWDPDAAVTQGPTNGAPAGVSYDVRIDNGNATNSTVTLDSNITVDILRISTLDALTILGHGLSVNSGTGCGNGVGVVDNAGTITAQGGLTVGGSATTDGSITNTGTISLSNGGDLDVCGPVQLGGTGTVTMGDDPSNNITGGAGTVEGTADKLIHQAGHTIQGVGSIGAGSGMSLENAGLIDANVASANKLIIGNNPTTTNTGTLRASSGGTLRIQTAIDNTGGTIEAQDGSVVELFGNFASITGGTLTTSGTGVIQALGPTNTLQDVAIASTVELVEGTVKLVGTITNHGTLRMLPTTQTVRLSDGDVTLTGTGVLEMSDTADSVNNGGTGDTLTHDTEHTIRGTGKLGTGFPLPLVNKGTIIADQATPLEITTTVGGFSNESTGTLQINAGSTLVVNQNFASAGTITGGGILNLSPGSAVRTVTNDGHVNPGSSAGTLTIDGHYTQGAGGALNMEIGGTAAGEFDKLAITGSATLGGTLNLSLIGNFVPEIGETFEIMTFASRSGTFSTVHGFVLPNGRAFKVNVGADNVTLDVVHLEHFLCYKAKTAPTSPKFEPKVVTLKDQFEEGSVEVLKPLGLCPPADKEGEGITDPNTHLEAYQIDPETAHVKQTNIKVRNQFHEEGKELVVDTIKPDRLLVPTAKSLPPDPPPDNPPDPATHDVDHYKCYKVKVSKGQPKFKPILGVQIEDQFIKAQSGQPKLFDLKKPTRLCTPVEKTVDSSVTEIKNPDRHLMCYQAKPAKKQAKHAGVINIQVKNQFGSEQLDTIKEEELCVPSEKIL